MAGSGVAQNQTVEEILASIRQAISDDEASRRGARGGAGDREPAEPRRPEDISTLFARDQDGDSMEPGDAATVVHDRQMQEVIDMAIEKALDGVRAELQAGEAQPEVTAGLLAKAHPDPVAAKPRQGGRTGLENEEPHTQRSLLSPRAGAAVSASFDNLARSMTPGHISKVDKVVEGILRPMLRSWLDDNLPTLVERLVREEIDRVSRGRR